MRKYFLLSAVALIISGNANATTDYAEVTAKATIEVAGTFECDDYDWGTIVVKQNNEPFTIDSFDGSEHKDLISISSLPGSLSCTDEFLGNDTIDEVKLTNENGDIITISGMFADEDAIYGAQLNIPANVKPGEYTGSFTITVTQ